MKYFWFLTRMPAFIHKGNRLLATQQGQSLSKNTCKFCEQLIDPHTKITLARIDLYLYMVSHVNN